MQDDLSVLWAIIKEMHPAYGLYTSTDSLQKVYHNFIGRETLGGAEGCSGGTIQHLTLPNTSVVVDFPWMRFVSVAKNPPLGHGIMPDHTVEYSPEDVVNKRDLDLKEALSLINR